MDNYKITIDDVSKTVFASTCLHLAGSILTGMRRKEGDAKDNRDLLSDDEKIILKSYKVLSSIYDTLSRIDMSCAFMKRSCGKHILDRLQINIIDYSLYHYEMFCYKVSTLRDLYFKLINILYDLKIPNQYCKWNRISEKREKINNEFLFSLLEDNRNYLKIINVRRNGTAHDGKTEHGAFDEISPYVTFTMYADKMPGLDDCMNINRNYYLQYRLKESRKNFQKEVEICRYNAFVYARCILCSLSDRFFEILSDETKSKYRDSLEKALLLSMEGMVCENLKYPHNCMNARIENGEF